MTARVRIGDQNLAAGAPALTPSHDAILDAAIRCFLPLGYGATTMEAVAKAAGITTNTIFYQFVGKEALFRAAVAHVWQTLPVVTIEPDLHANPETTLQQIGHSIAEFWSPPLVVGLLRMLLAEERRFPDLARSFVEADIMPITIRLTSYLESLRHDGRLINMPDAALAAKQFLGLINEPLLWSRVIGTKPANFSREERDQIVSEAVSTFLGRYGRSMR